MTKQQIVEAVAAHTERGKADVEVVVEAILSEVGKALASGEKVDLRGFGNFTVKEKKARQGRNPKTGETLMIAAKNAVTFKPSKELLEKVGPPKVAQATL
jgi:nucleoid DNA-binding protein